MEQQVLAWITQYGYFAIFFLLVFGIIGLPIPDETLLTFSGYLIYKGHLQLPFAFASALVGSATGITISYQFGRIFGRRVLLRYGKYLHLTEERLDRAHAWFARIGHWALTVGYFIPGVRHLTAYAAGISEVAPQQFAVFAYTGAVLWVTTFLSLGYLLGERWEAVEKNIHYYLVWVAVAIGVAAVGYVVWWKWMRKPK
ncbi:MAG TPA: DedA family protein [Bryobacteraceae bacterium]|nr:DedA family protein [Bryobacteraceae bacterium]